MELPTQMFFKKVADPEYNPTLIFCGRIFVAKSLTDRLEGHRLVINQRSIGFQESEKTLWEYDREYYTQHSCFRELKNEELRNAKELSQKHNDMISLLENNIALNFIENFVFPCYNPNRKRISPVQSEHKSSETNGSEEMMLLTDLFFRGGPFLIIGRDIKKLEKTSNPQNFYVHFSGIGDCMLMPYTPLNSLEKKFYNFYEHKLKAIVERQAMQLKVLETNKERLEQLLNVTHYTEEVGEGISKKKFGFRKYNGGYYVWQEVPPHSFRYNNKYFAFEATEVGLKIPVLEDKITEITIYQQEPVVFDEHYVHITLRDAQGLRTVCYKGAGEDDSKKNVEKEFERTHGNVSDQNLKKALKVKHILEMAGIDAMKGEGLRPDVGIFHPFSALEADHKDSKNFHIFTTEAEYDKWEKEKTREGYIIIPVGV